MNTSLPFTLDQLAFFIKKAAASTYAAGGKPEENRERSGFIELVYSEGNFSYRDSYTGFYRSWGTETVRFKEQPVWVSLYGGGMEKGHEEKAFETFDFLKKAFSNRTQNSFRGPDNFEDNDWRYVYKQEGDVSKFKGFEQIFYKNQLIFTHNIIGGIVIDRK